jgi:hypothetical protein
MSLLPEYQVQEQIRRALGDDRQEESVLTSRDAAQIYYLLGRIEGFIETMSAQLDAQARRPVDDILENLISVRTIIARRTGTQWWLEEKKEAAESTRRAIET